MRKAKETCIMTFHTTAAAIAMEKLCKREGLPGRLIPVPRKITSDCGMAWSAPPEEQERLAAAAAGSRIETAGFYTVMI